MRLRRTFIFSLYSFVGPSVLPVASFTSRRWKQIFPGIAMAEKTDEYFRSDGVRIAHDPYAPGMAEKYGLPGQTNPEGFDPYADTVGPGIYGGSVERNTDGTILIGEQYQNHNHRPGPVYDGRGYSLMSRAIHAGPEKVQEILGDFPGL